MLVSQINSIASEKSSNFNYNRFLCVAAVGGSLAVCRGIGGMLRACNTDPFLTRDLRGVDEKKGGVSGKKD